ncbi:chloride channel [Lactarius psammicola]|nr:chloride channel [Lactarius psammicola]
MTPPLTPPLERTYSTTSVATSTLTEVPSGPLSGPSDTTWRRQRLLHIGSAQALSTGPEAQGTGEATPFAHRRPVLQKSHSSYGTLPPFSPNKSGFRKRHGLPALPSLHLPGRRAPSVPNSPTPRHEGFDRPSIFRTQRPISAYDAPPSDSKPGESDSDTEGVVRANGIRVWYSSFTSVDWLHDAIKDSTRLYRLGRRKSVRGRMHKATDRFMGWVVVTIVGFLTAVVAFLIVRSEQWLFDIKYGFCATGWWKARRFCCPFTSERQSFNFALGGSDEICNAWVPWGNAFMGTDATQLSRILVGRTTYALLALFLALVSSILTIYLTASTSFVTRKDSGVLSPDFTPPTEYAKIFKPSSEPPAKRKVLYYAAGSGIPEIKTILSGFVIHGYLGGRTLFTKAVGLALSVASGLSLGKEGPFVHIASCIGNIVSRYFSKYENNEGKRREVLSAASAAGVAVAFGAPIGGVLFSLEEVSYFFPPKVMWRSFFCAMVAAVTLRFLDPFGTGKLVLFQVTYDKVDWHAFELVPFLLLGVFGGVYGAYFSKLNHRWSRDVRNKTWLKNHPIAEVLLITAITTILSFVNGYTLMGGTELVYNLFAMCLPGSPNTHAGLCVLDPGKQTFSVMRMIAVALVVKAALTVVTFGIKVPAGIFIPTLGVGACAGRIVGLAVQYARWRWPDTPVFSSCGDNKCVIPGLYAMVGAAAALSGVTRTTVSLAVIMFELTDTLTYTMPVMLGVLVAKTVADALEPKGIYELVIDLSQLPYLNAKHQFLWGGHTISDAMDRDVEVIHVERGNTVRTLRDQLAKLVGAGFTDTGFPILRRDEDGGSRMLGFIGGSELEHALSIVAEDADHPVSFQSRNMRPRSLSFSSSSISSILDQADDPFDFSIYMDKAPLTVNINSPLELVQQFFVKLGARYVVVTDADGYYEGVIDKNGWLAFLSEMEAKDA